MDWSHEKIIAEAKERTFSPKEFADTMRLVTSIGDTEADHGRGDELLCVMLERLGYGEGVSVFDGLKKWYA